MGVGSDPVLPEVQHPVAVTVKQGICRILVVQSIAVFPEIVLAVTISIESKIKALNPVVPGIRDIEFSAVL
jgi:hypothetical protein